MILEIKNGCFGYPKQDIILPDINLSLEEGHILAILGPNGIGKTTLLKCMIGLDVYKRQLRECPNVVKTRNGMPATAWKKYVNFASKNLPPSVYSGTFLFSGLLIILLITPKHDMLIVTAPSAYFYYSSLFLIL